jgi:glycosyltransferase involved in cell wall biosynthesis
MDPEPTQERPRAPVASVGLPVYNGAGYLEDSIESFLGQTFQDLELIISDNGSTDDTPEICRRFAERDPRVRFVRTPVNRGLAWNHNRVAALARGRYFMWAPADDRFAPDYVERCVEVLEADPGIAYVYGGMVLTDEHGNVLGREVNRYDLSSESASVRFWDQLIVYGGQHFYGMMPTSILRRIRPHRTFPWAERAIFTELSLYGRFHLIPGDRYFRRIHPGQLSAVRADRKVEITVLDPKREAWWRRIPPLVRAEYTLAFFGAVERAPLGRAERWRCRAACARWALGHVPGFGITDPRAEGVVIEGPPTAEADPAG